MYLTNTEKRKWQGITHWMTKAKNIIKVKWTVTAAKFCVLSNRWAVQNAFFRDQSGSFPFTREVAKGCCELLPLLKGSLEPGKNTQWKPWEQGIGDHAK